MRALSWKQPFAAAMLIGKIETRTWPTSYRGQVLICSSQKAYSVDMVVAISGWIKTNNLCNLMASQPTNVFDITKTVDLNGYAIAVGNLVDCRPMTPEDEATTFVKYHPDLWCHVYEDVKPIIPFKWIGSQGWREVHNSVIDTIQYL